jgi:hypothetical protein
MYARSMTVRVAEEHRQPLTVITSSGPIVAVVCTGPTLVVVRTPCCFVNASGSNRHLSNSRSAAAAS